MPEGRLERRLRDRLHGQLDAWQPSHPDPAQARYRDLALAGQGGGRPVLKGMGFGFVAGAIATLGVLILLTGSVQPQVWLVRAQGGVRHLEEDVVESRQPAASPQPTAAELPSPPATRSGSSSSNGSGRPPAAPTAVSSQDDQHGDTSTPTPAPSTRPTPTPSPVDGEGTSGDSGGHDGGASALSPSPSPTSSDGSSGHR
jgi:hypothetical protein